MGALLLSPSQTQSRYSFRSFRYPPQIVATNRAPIVSKPHPLNNRAPTSAASRNSHPTSATGGRTAVDPHPNSLIKTDRPTTPHITTTTTPCRTRKERHARGEFCMCVCVCTLCWSVSAYLLFCCVAYRGNINTHALTLAHKRRDAKKRVVLIRECIAAIVLLLLVSMVPLLYSRRHEWIRRNLLGVVLSAPFYLYNQPD